MMGIPYAHYVFLKKFDLGLIEKQICNQYALKISIHLLSSSLTHECKIVIEHYKRKLIYD